MLVHKIFSTNVTREFGGNATHLSKDGAPACGVVIPVNFSQETDAADLRSVEDIQYHVDCERCIPILRAMLTRADQG